MLIRFSILASCLEGIVLLRLDGCWSLDVRLVEEDVGEREVGGLVGVVVGAVLRERALWAGGMLPCWAALVLALVLAAGPVGGGRACTIRRRRRGRLGC